MTTMSCQTILIKDPSDVADFAVDWTDVLADDDDTIATHTITVDLEDPTVDDLEIYDDIHTDTAIIFWATKGVARRRYDITATIVTAGGRTWEMTSEFAIHEM